MSEKVLEACYKTLKEKQVSDEVAAFVREIVFFECFEKRGQFRKRYKETLERVCSK